jgi:hypothetical protein
VQLHLFGVLPLLTYLLAKAALKVLLGFGLAILGSRLCRWSGRLTA